jgi:hypothetical protein
VAAIKRDIVGGGGYVGFSTRIFRVFSKRVAEKIALFPSDWRNKNPLSDEVVKFRTVPALRSATAHFWRYDLLHT